VTVELRSLRWAIVASQHRSLRQAAEALKIRQSTLSRGLRSLEQQVGVTLFERTNGGTRPTIEGQEFLAAARRIIEETDAMVTRLRARSRGERGRLTIGVHASISAGNLRATLLEHRRRFPDVEMCLVDGSSDHLISDLANSVVDVAFVAEQELRWNDKSLSVWSERVVIALPDDHPLSRDTTVRWTDLAQETLMLPLRGTGPEFHQLLISYAGHADPSRLIVRHDMALDRFLTLVGAGWGVLLALEGATGATYPGVTFREVHHDEGPTRMNFRACWRQTNYNPSLRAFLDLLRERYPDIIGNRAD
jgi:DNA-binding transcriptional LysR family regulator